MDRIVKAKQSLQGILRRMMHDTSEDDQKDQNFQRTQLQKTASLEEKVLYPKISRLRQRRAVSVGDHHNQLNKPGAKEGVTLFNYIFLTLVVNPNNKEWTGGGEGEGNNPPPFKFTFFNGF